MKCVLLLLASLLGFTAAFGTFGMMACCCGSDEGDRCGRAAMGLFIVGDFVGVLVRRSGTSASIRSAHGDGCWG